MIRRSHRLPSGPPNDRQRVQARTEFADLLRSNTAERDWQRFFDTNPFVLSETLPIHYDALYTQVPLLTGVPDYVFHTAGRVPGTGDFGVIEIKKPNDAIIGTYSSKVLVPSRTLAVAHQQTKQYLRAIGEGHFINPADFFVAGNRRHAFIIIGLSKEIRRKCGNAQLLGLFRDLLPVGFHLYTYDEICDAFTERVGRPFTVLVARPEPLVVLLASENDTTPRALSRLMRDANGWEVISAAHGSEVVPAFQAQARRRRLPSDSVVRDWTCEKQI